MESTDSSVVKKRSPVSYKFLIFAVLIGVAAYFAVPRIMTYTMYLEEKQKAAQPPEFKEPSKERPSLPESAD